MGVTTVDLIWLYFTGEWLSEDTYGDDECDENFEDDEGDEDVKAYLCPKKG